MTDKDQDWAQQVAEGIVDRFVADETPEDLEHLQQAIAAALVLAEKGQLG